MYHCNKSGSLFCHAPDDVSQLTKDSSGSLGFGPESESFIRRRLRLRALSVSSGLLCNFVAVYLTFVHFILQLKLCLCAVVHLLLEEFKISLKLSLSTQSCHTLIPRVRVGVWSLKNSNPGDGVGVGVPQKKQGLCILGMWTAQVTMKHGQCQWAVVDSMRHHLDCCTNTSVVVVGGGGGRGRGRRGRVGVGGSGSGSGCSSSSSSSEYLLGGIITLLLPNHRKVSTKSVCSSQYMVTD